MMVLTALMDKKEFMKEVKLMKKITSRCEGVRSSCITSNLQHPVSRCHSSDRAMQVVRLFGATNKLIRGTEYFCIVMPKFSGDLAQRLQAQWPHAFSDDMLAVVSGQRCSAEQRGC